MRVAHLSVHTSLSCWSGLDASSLTFRWTYAACDRVLTRHHAGHVRRQIGHIEAEFSAALREVDGTCAGHQRIGRLAPHVDAGASEVVALDHSRLPPLTSAPGGDR